MYQHYFKPLFDWVAAILILLCLSPLLVLVWLCLTIANKGASALFLQERPGLNTKIFRIIKFKTMTDECDENGALLSDNQRLTKIGRFVRSTSMDELPQLLNVIKGDMSFIGPRPLRTHYLPLYSPEQLRRHHVRPGMSGWAQINGRNNISWTKKFELDIWYVDHCCFMTDLKILVITIMKIIKRKDINKEDEHTTVAFNGKN